MDQESKIVERRIALLGRLKNFRNMQEVYMLDALRAIQDKEKHQDGSLPPPNAEDIRLWMPSDLKSGEQVRGCQRGVVEIEEKLRIAQCADALKAVRSRLHVKRFLIAIRNAHSVGQKMSTRSGTLIGRMTDRINAHAEKYRQARRALIGLKGEEACTSLWELHAKDRTLDKEKASDAKAMEKLSWIGGRHHRPLHISTSRETLSWIWTAGADSEEEKDLHAGES